MRRKEKSSVPYSISLDPDLVNWIDENFDNRSRFIMEATIEYRNRYDGYELQLKKLLEQRDKVLSKLEEINKDIDEVKKMREEHKAKKESEEESSKEELKEIFNR